MSYSHRHGDDLRKLDARTHPPAGAIPCPTCGTTLRLPSNECLHCSQHPTPSSPPTLHFIRPGLYIIR